MCQSVPIKIDWNDTEKNRPQTDFPRVKMYIWHVLQLIWRNSQLSRQNNGENMKKKIF